MEKTRRAISAADSRQDVPSARTLVDTYGSPLFVLDRNKLMLQSEKITSAFRAVYPNTNIAYSVKTNYLPYICKNLYDQGSHIELISGFELDIAERLELDGTRLIVNGPYKPKDELSRLLDYTTQCKINVDNKGELVLLNNIAQEKGIMLKVGIRINSKIENIPLNQFGFSIGDEDIFSIIEFMNSDLKNLKLTGLSIHIGSNIADASSYGQASKQIVQIASEIKRRFGIDLEYIDLGGGLAPEGGESPREVKEENWKASKIEDYADAICKPLNLFYQNSKKPELIVEPGRYIVGPAMELLATVTAIKTIGGKRSVFVDAGINILASATRRRFEIVAYTDNQERSRADVYGPLCTQRDIIAADISIPDVRVGDQLGILSVGAYSLSESMQFIRARPAVISIEKEDIKLIRRKETMEDITVTDIWPRS